MSPSKGKYQHKERRFLPVCKVFETTEKNHGVVVATAHLHPYGIWVLHPSTPQPQCLFCTTHTKSNTAHGRWVVEPSMGCSHFQHHVWAFPDACAVFMGWGMQVLWKWKWEVCWKVALNCLGWCWVRTTPLTGASKASQSCVANSSSQVVSKWEQDKAHWQPIP